MRTGVHVIVAIAETLFVLTWCALAPAQPGPVRNVLTIHLGAESFPSNPILDAGIREALASRSDVPIDYFAEYLESDLFPDEDASAAFKDYLRRKYHGRRIDVVIAMTDTVLRFVLAHRAELFPDVPIVFMGLAGADERVRMAGGGATGMTVGIAYGETLKLALALQPATERVFVVANGADAQTIESAQAKFRTMALRIPIVYLNEPTVPRLLARVKELPLQSVVIYIWQGQHNPGQVLYSVEIARLVAHAARVPVYGTSDLYLGSGVVGGVVRGTRETGRRVGEMALQILTGTQPQDIPIESAVVTPIVDWRQLRRWGISEARVPPGSVVKFREPSVWDRYRIYIMGALTILLAQTALIAGLLVQRARRQEAEAHVRESQAELLGSYERIRDLGRRLLHAQEDERARIARELHDDISQQLALLEIDLEVLHGDRRSHELLAGETLHRAHSIAKSVRDLSHRLHPAKLRLIGLVTALHGLQRELAQPGIAIAITHENIPTVLPPDLTLCFYRIVQEALQNALRHSHAQHVAVHLSGQSDQLTVTIVDDGVGFDVKDVWGIGLGLISMAERIEAIGGRFDVRSKPGAGTRLEGRAPLSNPRVTHLVAV